MRRSAASFASFSTRGCLGSESSETSCARDDRKGSQSSLTSRISSHAFEPSLVSSSNERRGCCASLAPLSFASLGATLFRFRDGHFLGDRRGGVAPTLARASASERVSDGGSAGGTLRGATRLAVASGRGFEERISGRETRTKYCCIPYATSAEPHNARVYLSYAFTNFFDAALFPSLSSIASSREPDAARHGVRRGTGNGSHRSSPRDLIVLKKRVSPFARARSVGQNTTTRVTPRPSLP